MIIGVPREIKNNEYRVSMTPPGVQALVSGGHRVLIQSEAGRGSSITDEAYRQAGAEILPDARSVFAASEMILKVKEILPPEYDLFREGQILFTYLHSANNPEETRVLLDRKVVAFAYEDVLTDDGRSPLLTPMSEIAGEVGMIMAAYHMLSINGGSGILMGGAAGTEPARVMILGAGNVGLGAARYALGLGADVTILDIDLDRLREVRLKIFPMAKTLYLNEYNVRGLLSAVDLVVNGVKWPPRADTHIITREMLRSMKRDALIVDISCDPAGAVETCRATTHDSPTYVEEGIRHYCVDNLPSAVAKTASSALSSNTLPYVIEIASRGWLEAAKQNPALRRGLGFVHGYLTFEPTAIAQSREFTPAEDAIRMFDR